MLDKPNDYWKQKLTPEQFHITREKGTELPFSGSLLQNKDDGMYACVACGQDLFSSDTKFESSTGWPSFYDAVSKSNVKFEDDYSFGGHRVEVMCSNCGAHLGHVFPDGPSDKTGQRYCINSLALDFKKKGK